VMHVVEKLWKAGECLFREGTDALRAWVTAQKDRLYGGRIKALQSASAACRWPGPPGQRPRPALLAQARGPLGRPRRPKPSSRSIGKPEGRTNFTR